MGGGGHRSDITQETHSVSFTDSDPHYFLGVQKPPLHSALRGNVRLFHKVLSTKEIQENDNVQFSEKTSEQSEI